MPTLTKVPVDIERQVFDYVGTGNPTTILANAAVGATYRKLDGAAGDMVWQKTTAGWEALASTSGAVAWTSITGKPTTVGGYGITDFNSLGDARWSLLAHTHTFASLTSKPTTIGGYGITDFNSLGDARWLLLSGGTITGSVTFSGSVVSDLILSGSPTNNQQIQVGDSSVFGVHGAMFSSGYQFISYNAFQNTPSVDSWTQSTGGNASGLFEVRPDGFAFYSAVAGKAVGNKVTFWGGATFSLLSDAMQIAASLQIRGNNLPAATGTTLYIASGYSSPVAGRIFVGDGTGWNLKFSKRTGSVTTDLFSFNDDGTMSAVGTISAEFFFAATRGGTPKGYVGAANSANALVTGSVTDDLCVRSVVGGSRILFSVDNGASIAVSFGSSHLFNGNVTFTNNISVGGTLTVTGTSTMSDLHTTGAVQQKKGTATLYDTPTCTVSSSAAPGSSSGYPTGHEWIQVTAPI